MDDHLAQSVEAVAEPGLTILQWPSKFLLGRLFGSALDRVSDVLQYHRP